jgi:hypothetical protein
MQKIQRRFIILKLKDLPTEDLNHFLSTLRNIGLSVEFGTNYKRVIRLAMKELDLPRQNNLRKIYTQVKKLPESSIEKFIKLLIYLPHTSI